MKSLEKFLIKILIIYQNFLFINGCCCNNRLNKFFPSCKRETKNPCNDFYEYACDNYTQLNTDPNYNEITQRLEYDMNELLLKRMNYLQRKQQQQTNNDIIFIYWESCKNVKIRNILKYLEEIKPSAKLNWPLLEQNQEEWLGIEDNFDFWHLLGVLQSYGLNNVIIQHDIIRNQNNSLTIRLGTPFITEEENQQQPKIFEVLLTALGVTDVKRKVKEVLKMDNEWKKMVENSTKSMETLDLYLKDLITLYPQLNFLEFLEQLLGESEVENIDLIIVENPEYLKVLNDKIWTIRDLENLCNFLMLKFLSYVAKDSATEFTPLECIKDLRNKLDLPVNIFYNERVFQYWRSNYSKPFDEMLNKTKQSMALYFEENHLELSTTQIEYLKQKLQTIKVNIGNLPSSNKTIEEFYRNLPELNKENYYKNHLLLIKHRFRHSLFYAQNQTYFIATNNDLSGISSPFYVAQQNMVIIPYATMTPYFYNFRGSSIQQLSLLGFVLAHELTHAFDTNGLLYDHLGLPLSSDNAIMENDNFLNALNCMQQQELTNDIDERISDFFAVRIAYRTYKEFYARNETNWQKEFFINLAQFFCGKNNLKFIDHDSDTIRLQQIVKNFAEFSQAFGCAAKTTMNPINKCLLY